MYHALTRLTSKSRLVCSLMFLCFLLACGNGSGDGSSDDGAQPIDPNTICTNYPDWRTSEYVLPFGVGGRFRISQGNCTVFSHQNTLRYSYDIEMPFGSPVTAVRDGVIHNIRMDQPIGSRGLTASNWVQVRHDDGNISEYVHLWPNSQFFQVGDRVVKGDTLALTGDTGDVGDFPHLHFDISPCGNNLTCGTVAVTFSNTTANPNGLIQNQVYTAEAY